MITVVPIVKSVLASIVVPVIAAGVFPPTTPSRVPRNAVDVIEVAPVTTPASTQIVPSSRIADPPAGYRFSAAAEVMV